MGKVQQLFVAPPAFRPNTIFVGMQADLETLHSRLFQSEDQGYENSSVLITGILGSGKTHLAREYVFTCRESYPGGIFWVRASSYESACDGFKQIAQAAGLLERTEAENTEDSEDQRSQCASAVLKWLATREDWLLVFGGYLRKLKWIIQKSVVLWDEEAKRGWLLNGASALLHLVRASIMHDTTGPFSSECLFKWESLEEATIDTKNTSEFAIAVLLSHNNRALPIYEGKDDHVKFEDRVEHFLNILEQIFDYQVHAAGPDGSGYSSKGIPRAHFEGWGFYDLATELDTLHPRSTTFAAKGKAWVEFTRSIHAINLLGRDFGEILTPTDISCPHWASLPKDQYYLAAGISDLKMVLEYTGDLTTNPIRLNENLVWHNPDMVFEPCGCAHAARDHADIVQVILPASLSSESEGCIDAVNLAHDGAVVFGYNRNFQWRWGDTGDPEKDELTSDEQDQLTPTRDNENTNSNTISVGSESDVLDVSSSQIRSASTDITIDSTVAAIEPVHPRPLVRSYTKWQLESLKAEDCAVGIVCALPLELLAVRALFDQTHLNLPLSAANSNHYALGSMGRHKVVAACLPYGEYGTNSAADVASNLRRSFPSVKFCLLVGIGGGVPSSRNDIRLGDVVVSKPIGMSPGVIQYDMGKALENGEFEQSGFLQPPPRLVMTALSSLKSDPHLPQAPLQEYIQQIAACRKEYRYPGPETDRLFSIMHTIPSMPPAILAVQPILQNGQVEQTITRKYTMVSLHQAIES